MKPEEVLERIRKVPISYTRVLLKDGTIKKVSGTTPEQLVRIIEVGNNGEQTLLCASDNGIPGDAGLILNKEETIKVADIKYIL